MKLLSITTLLVAGAIVSTASAQAPPALTFDPHLSAPQPKPAVSPVPGPTSAAPVAYDPLLDPTPIQTVSQSFDENRLRVSVDVGLPTGVRIGAKLFHSNFWAEFGVGVWWVVPYVSTALRYDAGLYEGASNRIALRPSLSATFVPLDGGVPGFGADLEIIWQHKFSDRFLTDLGFRFGASAFRDRDDGRWLPIPVLSFVLAVQF